MRGGGVVRVVAIVLVLWLGLCIGSALPAPPPGVDLNPEVHAWFEKQYSKEGKWCCNEADGHYLEDTQWRHHGAFYQVRLGSDWVDVPDESMRDPNRGGPNKTGRAIVWYVVTATEGKVVIYCFAPGTEY